MRMKKKGALELSVNTIVIIVIGVALLSLGLIFIKNLFGGMDRITEGVFGSADTTIRTLHSGAKLTVPTTVNVKQNSVVRADIFVGNNGLGCTSNSFRVVLTPSTCPATAKICTKIISPQPVTINEGEEGTFVVGIAATKDAPLSTGTFSTENTVSVEVTCGGAQYDTSAFTINVQKGAGLLG